MNYGESSDFELNNQFKVIDTLCKGFTEDLRLKSWDGAWGRSGVVGLVGAASATWITWSQGLLTVMSGAALAPIIGGAVVGAAGAAVIPEIWSRWSWNEEAKQNAFNEQLATHLEGMFDSKVNRNICKEFRKQVQE